MRTGLLDIAPSPANCLEFCQGTISEMASQNGRARGTEVVDAVRQYARQGKIAYVHFRAPQQPPSRARVCHPLPAVSAELCRGAQGMWWVRCRTTRRSSSMRAISTCMPACKSTRRLASTASSSPSAPHNPHWPCSTFHIARQRLKVLMTAGWTCNMSNRLALDVQPAAAC